MNSTERKLDIILNKLARIEEILSSQMEESFHQFVSEQDAKKIFKKGTTWFWELRQIGLPYSKVGGQVYYRKSDLLTLLRDGSSAFEDNI